ncbi:hypothetical protein [Nocardiopsis coralliicola]
MAQQTPPPAPTPPHGQSAPAAGAGPEPADAAQTQAFAQGRPAAPDRAGEQAGSERFGRLAAGASRTTRAAGRAVGWMGRTTPGRIRLSAAAALAAAALLFAVASGAFGQAREGISVIGHGAGKKVAASASLYLALSDMDAHSADLLLVGEETGGAEDDSAAEVYDERRVQASAALVQAAQLAGDNQAEQRNVEEVVEGLGTYERLVTEARSSAREDGGDDPPDEAVATYREATDLMRLELLPKSYNLTLESGATVRATYEEKRTAVLAGAAATGAAGLLAVGALLWNHHCVATRFRRRISPPVAAAAAIALLLSAGATGSLLLAAERMRTAKEDGLDSILGLARAEAISSGMRGDESRFLLDGERADTYAQVFLESARSVAFVEGDDLAAYTDEVTSAARAGSGAELLGLLGREAERAESTGSGGRVDGVVDAYAGYLRADAELRRIAEQDGAGEAADSQLEEVDEAYVGYVAALGDLRDQHTAAYDGAVASGDRGLASWPWLLPGAVALLGALVVAGAYPRLAEYR